MAAILKLLTLGALLRGALAAAAAQESTSISPVVSVAWVSENLADSRLVVLDVRDAASYSVGHIPASLSLPYYDTPLWYSMGENDTLVMPSAEVMSKSLGSNGLLTDRRFVIVTDVKTLPTEMAMGTRAAATLRYAGVSPRNIALLDGGFPAWRAAGLRTSNTTGTPRPGTFTGRTDASFVVDRAYVHARLGKAAQGAVIVDARPKTAYDTAHIESAISLPAANIWKSGGIFKAADELLALFEAAVGDAPVGAHEGEIIVYCWIGMLATTWFYVLSSVLGFENVKLYDGSYEDWTKEYKGVASPMT